MGQTPDQGIIRNTVPCPILSHGNVAGAKFCATCGAGLVPACPACGSPLKPGIKFCGSCGQPVSLPPPPPAEPPSPPGGPPATPAAVAICLRCGYPFKPGVKFCEGCGTPVGVSAAPPPPPVPTAPACSRCGVPLKPGIKFCGSCGQPVSPTPAPAVESASAPSRRHSLPELRRSAQTGRQVLRGLRRAGRSFAGAASAAPGRGCGGLLALRQPAQAGHQVLRQLRPAGWRSRPAGRCGHCPTAASRGRGAERPGDS